MTTTTITLVDAPEVTFISVGAPDEDLVQPLKNAYWHKPEGGIWTCPAGAEENWANWCATEMPEWIEGTDTYRLTPRAGTQVAVIDSFDDLRALIEAYPLRDALSGTGLNFEAMARDFDGIWLTARGQWATRFTTPGLYGWDVETVLFFRWSFQ
jgi:hypothetical protein